MNEKDFLENYLWPSDDRLDRAYTFPLPNIEGLKKCGNFIVQCEYEDTFSTNIITKYESDILGVTVKEVYKNTQNKVTGVFVRLIGTMNIVKNGYPRLSLDAPIANVNPLVAEREDITTRVFVLLPQADPEQRKIFSHSLSELAKEAGVSLQERQIDILPEFWGTIMMSESKGVNLDVIPKVREIAWSSYKRVIEQTKERIPFDYRQFQEHMVFDTSKRESISFNRSGLSMPIEAQAAFFSVTIPHL
jgi:hypothetical protein